MTILEFERRKRGWTLTDLSNQLLYSTTHLSNLENGKMNPKRINRRLGHALESLFGMGVEELLADVRPASNKR